MVGTKMNDLDLRLEVVSRLRQPRLSKVDAALI